MCSVLSREPHHTGSHVTHQAIAAKPFVDFEADWGKGTFNGDGFVTRG